MDPDRPLSPHLQIYRWPLAMVISILHRITGAALGVGALLMVGALLSIAAGPGAYEVLVTYISTALGQVFLILWTLALFLHLFNGVRHLVFDAGFGFGIDATRISGIVVLAATILFTAAVWLVAWLNHGMQA